MNIFRFIESSFPQEQGDNAILVSPPYIYKTSGPKCVELWYHAYGIDTGTLNVYKLQKGGLGNYQKLYSISGDQGPEWFFLNLFCKQTKNF